MSPTLPADVLWALLHAAVIGGLMWMAYRFGIFRGRTEGRWDVDKAYRTGIQDAINKSEPVEWR